MIRVQRLTGLECLVLPFAIVAVLGLATGVSLGAKYNDVVEIGDLCPKFSELPSVDGKAYGSEELAKQKAVAIVFTSNNCPVARAYEGRMKSIAKDFADEPFTLLAVNVNERESLEKMRQHATENEFNFPYVRDESKQLGKQLGATCTPHAFLFDSSGKIVYMGAIDNTWKGESDETEPYLRNAIKATLAGQTPEVTETKQVGCSIKW